ncbi:MAG: NYN domain-containing protein [Minisyncoccia bacterium]
MLNFSDQRVGIFIDIQNIYHSAKNLFNARVNFQTLSKFLSGKRNLIVAVAYVVKSELVAGELNFFEALKQFGFELRIKDLQIYPDGTKKADWDVGIAVDAIRMSSLLDAIILVTGDGDFAPLVTYLQLGLGKQVEVAAFNKTASAKLKETADKFIDLESIPGLLLESKSTNAKSRKKNF